MSPAWCTPPSRDATSSSTCTGPTAAAHGCPVLVEIHGGGWIAGDRRLEARPLMAHMAARGWVCVSVDYRVGRTTTWPDQIIDVNTALAWVREHIADYGGDPDFVAITGGSAGGHLAALAALAPDDPDVSARSRDRRRDQGVCPVLRAVRLRQPPRPAPTRRDAPRRASRRQGAPRRATRRSTSAPRPWRGFTATRRRSSSSRARATTWSSRPSPAAFVDRLRAISQSAVAYVEVPRGQHAFDAVPSVRTGHVITGVERFLTHIHSPASPHRILPPREVGGGRRTMSEQRVGLVLGAGGAAGAAYHAGALLALAAGHRVGPAHCRRRRRHIDRQHRGVVAASRPVDRRPRRVGIRCRTAARWRRGADADRPHQR